MATIKDMLDKETYRRASVAEGLAMGNIPPGKGGSPGQPYQAPQEDPKNPYVPAPKRDLAMDDPLADYDVTDKGYFMDYNGDMYMNLDGMLFPMGQGYERGTHGELVPKGLVQSMQINQDVANITPKDFSPPPFRYFNHIRTPEIKKQEMKHMKNFIEAMGGDTKGLVKKNSAMKVYGS